MTYYTLHSCAKMSVKEYEREMNYVFVPITNYLWHSLDGSMAAVDQALEVASSPLCVLVLCSQDFPLRHQRLAVDGLALNVFSEFLQRDRKIVCGSQRGWMHGAAHLYKAAVALALNDQRFVKLFLFG